MPITIIGGGLAGCEAAWQAASRGVPVTLHEMRPVRPTAVHKTDRLAELVCSNSFRGDKLDNAVGLLKEEMRRLGSLVMRVAEESRVPAGAALAVDREKFAEAITTAMASHPLITIVRDEVTAIPESSASNPVIVATGLPIEEMAQRGVDTLLFGPMKPLGLVDPKTGREPYAAVQLRQDNLAGDHFSLVGFQTQIKWGDQARVLRLIPGLKQAELVRFGMVHRNTYVNGPTVLDETWQVRRRPTTFFAGQMSGVEGYVESAASGLLAGLNAAALAKGEPVSALPRTTAIGALAYYVSHANPAHYEPSNITFGIIAPLVPAPRGKKLRNEALSARALADLDAWIAARPEGRALHAG